jgi:hypothetical protein
MHSILFYPDINYLLVYAFVHQSKHFFILYYILQPFLFRYYKLDRRSIPRFLIDCQVDPLQYGDASQIPKEETIKDAVETQDSPYDDKTIIQSIKKRTSSTSKQIAPRGGGKRRKKNVLHHDPDINALMRIYGEQNVKVVYDSDP